MYGLMYLSHSLSFCKQSFVLHYLCCNIHIKQHSQANHHGGAAVRLTSTAQLLHAAMCKNLVIQMGTCNSGLNKIDCFL